MSKKTKPEITGITIQIDDDTSVTLTMDQSKTLYGLLDELFGSDTVTIQRVVPNEPFPRPWWISQPEVDRMPCDSPPLPYRMEPGKVYCDIRPLKTTSGH